MEKILPGLNLFIQKWISSVSAYLFMKKEETDLSTPSQQQGALILRLDCQFLIRGSRARLH